MPYGQPSEGIALTAHFISRGWMYRMIPPKVFVDGYQMPVARWGRTVLPVRAGSHHVHVHCSVGVQYGSADTTVFVPPGRLVELEYSFVARVGGYFGPPVREPRTVEMIIMLAVLIPIAAIAIFTLILMIAAR